MSRLSMYLWNMFRWSSSSLWRNAVPILSLIQKMMILSIYSSRFIELVYGIYCIDCLCWWPRLHPIYPWVWFITCFPRGFYVPLTVLHVSLADWLTYAWCFIITGSQALTHRPAQGMYHLAYASATNGDVMVATCCAGKLFSDWSK